MSDCDHHDMLDHHAAGCSACLAASHAELLAFVRQIAEEPASDWRSAGIIVAARVVVARAVALAND